MIRSWLSCAGGRVEREGESGGRRRDEMPNEKVHRTRGQWALQHDPSLNTRQSLQCNAIPSVWFLRDRTMDVVVMEEGGRSENKRE